jgi:hypothetical protein
MPDTPKSANLKGFAGFERRMCEPNKLHENPPYIPYCGFFPSIDKITDK